MAKILIELDDEICEETKEHSGLAYIIENYLWEVENAIKHGTLLPDNLTNGDMIKAMFPNLKTGADPYIPSVDIYVGGILMMRVDRNWWNAPYKAGDTDGSN